MSSEAGYAPAMRCDVVYCEALSSTTPIGERISTSAVFVDQQCSTNCARSVMFNTSSVCEKESGELTLGWSVHAAKE
jgi:hypothetical protein